MADAPPTVSNELIAELLERVAIELEEQRANPYRIDAYRAAARVVREHGQTAREPSASDGDDRACSVQELALAQGRDGLDELPHIGASLAAAIEEIAHTGRLRLLDRLEGGESPLDGLTRIPGIGDKLEKRIQRELHVFTLEGLLAAARDGRLAALDGFGPRRVESIRTIVETLLARSPRRTSWRARSEERAAVAGDVSRSRASTTETVSTAPTAAGANSHRDLERSAPPSVALLLDLDRRYRELAAARELPKIAPSRNNPSREAWLPVLHTEAEGWQFTALFSNTDRAHELGRTRDWVVLYYERSDHEDQCTVVTEVQGKLAGRRVVRGREGECTEHYHGRREG